MTKIIHKIKNPETKIQLDFYHLSGHCGRGPWSYRPFEVVHHTPMICNMQNSFLWNRITSYGHKRPLYTTWSSEHWQLKGVVDAQESGQFKLCHIIRGEYIKGITRGCNINNWRYPVGGCGTKVTYRRSLYVWI